ncbi:hypothetical protein J2797_006196 [Paraburkholderia terricola]|uniref:hypothetical protein n=1 Tax=Paraburkholderia terricola TaxID=169427 RepID=UPI002864279B|nr:hypothetical protein [Paraburkholderia terricola]MDR6496269.1 hypothetical protein [Paraburkholderia terricola]
MKADLPVPAGATIADAAHATDDSQCKWRASGDFALVHPSGWTIARYSVHDQWHYLLWEPIDRCTTTRGNQFYGPFDNVRDAMRLQRELTAHPQQQEMAA